MAENDSTAGSAIPEELAGVQSQLEQMMGSADDRTKRLIFNQLICKLTEVLPEPSPEFCVKEPVPMSASARNLLDVTDKLREASFLAEFIQSISLNTPKDGEINLHPGQTTGFYYAMRHVITGIREADELIGKARAKPEALRPDRYTTSLPPLAWPGERRTPSPLGVASL